MNYKRFQLNLIHLSAIDSTNNYAANLLKETNVVNGTSILTKRQDFGRGQRGNVWKSEPDKNLLTSIIVFPELRADKSFYLNIVVSLAVEKTLRDLGLDAKIKWPNDIYVNDNKISGILVETQIQGGKINRAILGIGLNVNQENFPAVLKATSIINERGDKLDLEDIFMQLYGYLDFYIDHLMNSNFALLLKRYYENMYRFEETYSFKDESGIFQGKITGIDGNGRLIIQVDQAKRVYDLKEVEYCLTDGD